MYCSRVELLDVAFHAAVVDASGAMEWPELLTRSRRTTA